MPTRSKSRRAARPATPATPFRLETFPPTHRIGVWSEREFSADELEANREGEPPSDDDAVSEVLSLDLKVDGLGRSLTVERGYRRRTGIVGQRAETCNLSLDDHTWAQFVAIVNAADAKLKQVLANNPPQL